MTGSRRNAPGHPAPEPVHFLPGPQAGRRAARERRKAIPLSDTNQVPAGRWPGQDRAPSNPFDGPPPQGRRLLRGGSMAALARQVGVVLGAGLLAAVYQLTLEEGRGLVQAIHARGRARRERHERLLVATLGTSLDPTLQNRLLRSRDAFVAARAILADPDVAQADRDRLRAALNDAA